MGQLDEFRINDFKHNFSRGSNAGVEIELFDSNSNRFGTENSIFGRDYLVDLNDEYNASGIYIDIPIIGGMGGGETGQIVTQALELLMVIIGPFLGGLFVNFSYDVLKTCILNIIKKARPQHQDHLIHIEHADKVIVYLYNPDRESNDEELDRSLRALLADVKLAEDTTDIDSRLQERLSKFAKG